MKKKISVKKMVKVDSKVHSRVSKKVAGKPMTIGEFYDFAAKLLLGKKPIPISETKANH
jgi:hypothetical protein